MNKKFDKKLELLLQQCPLEDLKLALGEHIINLTDYLTGDVTKKNAVKIALSAYGRVLLEWREVRYILILQHLSCEKINQLGGNLKCISVDTSATAQAIAEIPYGRKSSSVLILDSLGLSEDYLPDRKELLEPFVETIIKEDEFIYEQLDYQYDIRRRTIKYYREKIGGRALVHMPTGSGKTKTAMHIIQELWKYDYKEKGCIVWMAHSEELLNQAVETFRNSWKYLGQFSVDIVKLWGKCQEVDISNQSIIFAGIQKMQSLSSRNVDYLLDISNNLNLLVVDECHRATAPKTRDLIVSLIASNNRFEKIPNLLGLTATPGRSSGYDIEDEELRIFFDNQKIGIDVELISKYDYRHENADNEIELLQNRDILSRFDRQPIQISSEDLKLTPSEINQIKEAISSKGSQEIKKDILTKIANNKKRNHRIITKLIELDKKELKTLFFSCSVDHAKIINAAMKYHGVESAIILGETRKQDRARVIDSFKDNQSDLNILINFAVLTTGFDSPNIDCIFIARPVSSVILYSQMIGRGIRGPRMGGKDICILIDVIDNLDFGDEKWAFNYFDSYWN